jgi:hypothetical protein
MRLRNICEGKAIELSQDMVAFAQETLKAISDLGNNIQYGQTVHTRIVDGGKYGSRNVTVIAERPHTARAAYADPPTGNIVLHCLDQVGVGDALNELIQHELIHLFDPKLTNEKLHNSKWGINSKNAESINDPEAGYYTHPWEQDAFMRQTAEATIRDKAWLFDGDQSKILQGLRNIKPQDPWEIEWYKDKKMWRKYLNTIYQVAMRAQP